MFCSTMIAKEKLQIDTWHIACAMCLLFNICALLVCLQFGHINSLPFTSDSLRNSFIDGNNGTKKYFSSFLA